MSDGKECACLVINAAARCLSQMCAGVGAFETRLSARATLKADDASGRRQKGGREGQIRTSLP